MRPTSRASRLQPAGPRAATGTRCGLCGACVLFCLVSLSPRALSGPGGAEALPACPLRPAPQRPPGSALRASPPAPSTRPAPPRDRHRADAVWPQDACAARRASPHFRASREQTGPERSGISEAPCPGAKARRGYALEGWRRLGRRTLFSPSTRFGFWGRRRGSAETVGKRRESFVVRAGSGLGSGSAGNL